MSEFDSQSQPQTVTEVRRVRRSRQDRVIGGVCGGLGRYLQVDPVLLRIAAVALALSGGLGVLAYIIAWIAIPEETGDEPVLVEGRDNRHGVALVVGAALVALGGCCWSSKWSHGSVRRSSGRSSWSPSESWC